MNRVDPVRAEVRLIVHDHWYDPAIAFPHEGVLPSTQAVLHLPKFGPNMAKTTGTDCKCLPLAEGVQ